jgi:ATP-dependent DNA helicase RecQ
LFLELMRWAEGGSCRHDAILRYFGDEGETLHGCGRCDNCQALGDGDGASEDAETVTLVVRKALSGVARVHRRFGLQAAAKLLHGTVDPRFEWSGLHQTPTFGVLADRSEEWLLRLLRRCVTAGWVDFEGGERPLAVLTPSGRAVMKGERPARLLLPAAAGARKALAGSRASGGKRAAVVTDALDARAERLFEALRAHRMGLARGQGVPPYVIASDRTLREIALAGPATIGELLEVHGIGAAKAERYGAGLLEIVARATGP